MDALDAADWSTPVLRIGLAAVTGVLIGLNRDLKGKAIGVRTMGVVAVACCALTLAAIQFGGDKSAETMGRATQGLMAGIGFLGGGVILRTRPHHIHGLTTAALVWLTAALGVACGAGAWATVTTALAAVFLLLLSGGPLERSMHALLSRSRRAMGKPPLPPEHGSHE
jgi:putative Mg2+ transporter-C (MgtC) family protein